MELKLALPAYAPPQANVETRPKQVQAWLNALPLAHSQAAGRQLADAIAATNSVKLSEEARCNLLEMYRATVNTLLPSLQQLYLGKPLPLSEKSQQAAALLRTLYGELANGYKRVLLDLAGRHAHASKLVPLALARASAYLGGVLEVFYETYAPTPAGSWSDLHRLYWYAAKLNVHKAPITEQDTSNIDIIYTQVLLLALADPYRLLQGQLAVVKTYLAQFGQQALLQPMGPIDNKHGLFLVRLDSDKSPKALLHYQGVTDAGSDIILNTIPLARVLHRHIQELDLPPLGKSALPQGAHPAGYRDLLKHLMKQWGIAPKRLFNRAQGQAEADICGGISALHRLLSVGEESDDLVQTATLEVSDALHVTGSPLAHNCARWLVVNESAGGVTLAKAPGSQSKIKVGDIIGMDTGQPGARGIALVRWMQSSAPNRVEAGAQMLAPQAEAITLKPVIAAANALFQPALLLPEEPLLKQPARIVAARGSFQSMREFEVRSRGSIHLVRADQLLEQTDSLDLFTFN